MRDGDPAAVLAQANAALVLQEDRLVTAICGFVDPATHDVVYACAGHPPPVLVREREGATFLPLGGVPLGAFADATFESHRVAIAERRALIVLYTDGIIEFNRNPLHGEVRLLAAAEQVWRRGGDLAARIRETVLAGTSALDDVAILTIDLTAGGDGSGRVDDPPHDQNGRRPPNAAQEPGTTLPTVPRAEESPSQRPPRARLHGRLRSSRMRVR
jgi:hypothetical protein